MNIRDFILGYSTNKGSGGGGGSSVTIEPLEVTENGEYTAPTGKAYSPVSVNVSGSATTMFTGTADFGDGMSIQQIDIPFYDEFGYPVALVIAPEGGIGSASFTSIDSPKKLAYWSMEMENTSNSPSYGGSTRTIIMAAYQTAAGSPTSYTFTGEVATGVYDKTNPPITGDIDRVVKISDSMTIKALTQPSSNAYGFAPCVYRYWVMYKI